VNFDPVRLEIYKNLFHSIAEEMGATLRRTGFSPNIKERRDYSCALFNAAGEALAMGDHMPVHLGSMPMSVQAALAVLAPMGSGLALEPGDIAMVNDPFAGGTHLPDITLVMPVFLAAGSKGGKGGKGGRGSRGGRGGKEDLAKPAFYVANRAHHSDVGGAQPGSMGPAREIFQEGVRIPPIKIARRGQLQTDVLRLILANVRTPAEREGDLTAQVAACRVGERRLGEMVGRYGQDEVARYCHHMLDYSERMMRSVLRQIPDGNYFAEDFLDDDGISDSPLRIAVAVRIRGDQAEVDFSGTSPQCAGAVNAVLAITYSAVFYVFRCLIAEEVPATSGLMRPMRVVAPPGTLVNAGPPAAVAGGNVETSQRTVDVLFRALARAIPRRIPAASQGTMNNLTLGGWDGQRKAPFAYYETVAGGMGGRPGKPGISGIHTHMTNSLNSPVEALEFFYPVRVLRYGLRRGSGGEGKFRGGDGVVREIELLADAQLGLLCDRRKISPYGLAGGAPGKRGRNSWRFGRRVTKLPGKCTAHLPRGAVIRIETPGGGGWGKPKH